MITRKKVDTKPEKLILTGMIVSDEFLKEFQYLYKPELFQISFIKIVAGWCWDYYQEYEKAPGQIIQNIFEEKSSSLNEEISQAIEGMLLNLSDEFNRQGKFDYQYILNKAEIYLQTRNLESFISQVEAATRKGELKEAETIISGFNQIKHPESDGIDFFNDFTAIKDILNSKDLESVLTLKGAAGEIISDLCREELFGILAPEKRGKTWTMQEIKKQGILKGFNVAWFNFEMPKKLLLTRFIANFTGRPILKKHENCLIPIFDCSQNQNQTCKIVKRKGINDVKLVDYQGRVPSFKQAPENYNPCSICKNSKDKDIKQLYELAIWYTESNKKAVDSSSIKKLKAMKPYIRGARLKVVTWPGRTKSIKDIKNQLSIWEDQDNFIPDIIITDYADIMLPDDKSLKVTRDKIDDIWLGHKQLAQEKRCLVITASQANKESYEKRIKKGSWAEDKRKAGHCDKAIALNQTQEEKAKNIMRWSVIFERNGEESNHDIVILQQLKIGNAYLDSYVDESYDSKENKT